MDCRYGNDGRFQGQPCTIRIILGERTKNGVEPPTVFAGAQERDVKFRQPAASANKRVVKGATFVEFFDNPAERRAK